MRRGRLDRITEWTKWGSEPSNSRRGYLTTDKTGMDADGKREALGFGLWALGEGTMKKKGPGGTGRGGQSNAKWAIKSPGRGSGGARGWQ